MKVPWALFDLEPDPRQADPARVQRLDQYIDELADALAAAMWDQDVLEMLDLVPQVFRRLGDRVELPVDVLPILNRHMHVVLETFKAERNTQLEELLLLSPEYVFHLLTWAESAQPPCRIKSSLDATALLVDPYWAVQWHRTHPDQAFGNQIIQAIHHTCEFHPRSAWLWFNLFADKQRWNRSQRVAELKQRLPLFHRDPQLCLRLACDYPELDRRVLFRSAVRFPALLLEWAKRYPDVNATIVRTELLRHPAWLAQYIVDCKPEDGRELFRQARERCQNAWLQPWLDDFAVRLGRS